MIVIVIVIVIVTVCALQGFGSASSALLSGADELGQVAATARSASLRQPFMPWVDSCCDPILCLMLNCTVLYCTVLYCIMLRYTVLYYTVLHPDQGLARNLHYAQAMASAAIRTAILSRMGLICALSKHTATPASAPAPALPYLFAVELQQTFSTPHALPAPPETPFMMRPDGRKT